MLTDEQLGAQPSTHRPAPWDPRFWGDAPLPVTPQDGPPPVSQGPGSGPSAHPHRGPVMAGAVGPSQRAQAPPDLCPRAGQWRCWGLAEGRTVLEPPVEVPASCSPGPRTSAPSTCTGGSGDRPCQRAAGRSVPDKLQVGQDPEQPALCKGSALCSSQPRTVRASWSPPRRRGDEPRWTLLSGTRGPASPLPQSRACGERVWRVSKSPLRPGAGLCPEKQLTLKNNPRRGSKHSQARA